jgi:hypothetical protein
MVKHWCSMGLTAALFLAGCASEEVARNGSAQLTAGSASTYLRDGGPAPDGGPRDGGPAPDGGPRDGGPAPDGGSSPDGGPHGGCLAPAGYQPVHGDPTPVPAGTAIAVSGTIELGPVRCTRNLCTPANPCCNSCGAGIALRLASGAALEMQGMGCSGNNCNVLAQCTYPVTTPVTAWGTLRQGYGRVYLDVEGHCAH